MTRKPPFEIVKTTMGAVSIRDMITGEIFHNPVGPWTEANALYVVNTRLEARLKDLPLTDVPLILFDVGLGAGFNAVAAIHAFHECQKTDVTRPLKIVSFEQDMKSFEFVLQNIHEFPFMNPYEDMMKHLLTTGEFTGENGFSWELRRGPFEKTIQKEKLSPEVIFFDPYSPKSSPAIWELTVLKRLCELALHCPVPPILATYSIATPVRVTFLLAGFFVGIGPQSGLKLETTQASTDKNGLQSPLGYRWLERWHRSRTPYPLGVPQESLEQLKEKILKHPQFVNLPPVPTD